MVDAMKALFLKIFSLVLLFKAPTIMANDAPQVGRAFDFEMVSIDGKPMPLKAYEGRVMLVVNTASFCGFTRQYKDLQALYETYEPKGLVVLGVPSNDFGQQEPGSAGQIKEFCEGNFGITFPMTEKVPVTGANAAPLYKWFQNTLGANAVPGWNFHKFVVGRDGRAVASFNSGVAPDAKDLLGVIEAELAKPKLSALH